MNFVYIIIGAVVGLAVGQNGLGAIAGTAIGYLLGELQLLKTREKYTVEQVKGLISKVNALQASSRDHSQQESAEAYQEKGQVTAEESLRPEEEPVKDQYVQAIKDSILERKQSSLTIEDEVSSRNTAQVNAQGDIQNDAQSVKSIRNSEDDNATSPDVTFSNNNIKPVPYKENAFLDGISTIFNTIIGFFTTGNVLVKVGVVVLFFGVSFLVKLAAENALFPIEYRLIAVAIGGIIMLAVGWRLRDKRFGYAVALQGGGIGFLYLTVYAAFRLYNLLPPTISFALLVLIAVTSAIISVRQDSKSLAILSTVGGFLAPVLASTGEGSHVALFSYYIVLNLGVLFIAWFKSWRMLNVISFIFTFVIASMWGYKAYKPEHFSTTEPFLIAFFLIYTLLAVFYALRKQSDVKNIVDGTIVFGTPLIAFALQSKLVENIEYGMAFSALALAFYYIVLAFILNKRLGDDKRLITESFLSIGIVFATLTIPFAFESNITSALWALESAAIIWIGARQNQWLARAFGLALLVVASVIFIFGLDINLISSLISTRDYLGSIILFIAIMFASYVLHKNRNEVTKYEYPFISHALLLAGFALWITFGLAQVLSLEIDNYYLAAILSFMAMTMVGSVLTSKWLSWPQFSYVLYVYIPFLTLMLILMFIGSALSVYQGHPATEGGWIGWPVALAALYWCLRHFDNENRKATDWMHVGGILITLIVITWELGWRIERLADWSHTWNWMIWGMLPSIALWCICAYGPKVQWPILKHKTAYLKVSTTIVAGYTLLWALFMNLSGPGDPAPLSYIPFLNPVDISTLVALFALVKFYQTITSNSEEKYKVLHKLRASWLLFIGLFIWINAFVLRIIHFWKGVPYDLDVMLSSQLVQATFSILWATIAVVIMVFSSKKSHRTTWLIGAGLIGAVVVKLFLIDLSNSGTVERIIAFLVVGVLLLLVGYFSPVPPKNTQTNEEDNHKDDGKKNDKEKTIGAEV
jgi:uncharacterized membrane protein